MRAVSAFEGGSQVFPALFFNIGFTVHLHTELMKRFRHLNLLIVTLDIDGGRKIIIVFFRGFLDVQGSRFYDKGGDDGGTSHQTKIASYMILKTKGNTEALWYECILRLLIDYFKAELIYP